MCKNIAVIFGGKSNEHEISVITGTMALNVLKSGGDRVIPLYISRQGEIFTGEGLADIRNFKDDNFQDFNRAFVVKGGIYVLNKRLRPKKFVSIDAALNCCHGGTGEGGGVCGLFALNDIPFASAGMFESAAFMDKYYTKLVLESLGVSTVPYVYMRGLSEIESAKELGFPLIVKPAKLGSSIGIECAENSTELENALSAAFVYDDGAIVEKFIEDRREINCAAYFADGKVFTSECEEVFTCGVLLSYDDKYSGGGKSVLPANIDGAIAAEIKKLTATVYSKLNMRGIVRFDYILSGNKVYLSEINTVPGSLSYYLLSGGFKQFYTVLQAVIAQAFADFKAASDKKVLTTGILKNLPSNACKLNRK